MIVVTSEAIAGKRIVRTLGLVRGNTVRARHVGRDILAGLRTIVAVRFTTSVMMAGAAELLAVGTAVVVEDADN